MKQSSTGLSYSLAASSSEKQNPVIPSLHKTSDPTRSSVRSTHMADLFHYDVILIYKDLAKTVSLTLIMFAALIGLSFII